MTVRSSTPQVRRVRTCKFGVSSNQNCVVRTRLTYGFDLRIKILVPLYFVRKLEKYGDYWSTHLWRRFAVIGARPKVMIRLSAGLCYPTLDAQPCTCSTGITDWPAAVLSKRRCALLTDAFLGPAY